jgi:hypothetical protein
MRRRKKRASTVSPIYAFGLFWHTDEIDWFPGRGKRHAFRMLGRQGKYSNALRMADFRDQLGLYILYGNYGPHYAGLTQRQTFGKRLKAHMLDEHKGKWDRFSWFGFKQVLKRRSRDGLHRLRERIPERTSIDPKIAIEEMKALLIKAMALTNIAETRFANAQQWEQVKRLEADTLLERAARSRT